MHTSLATAGISATSPAAHRYRAFARIGRGGMAEVFLAVAPGAAVTKLVVLKRMWPELTSDPAFTEMFLDEARLSARMSHPNVVQTYDVIEQAGRLTMAMEYLDGQPLTRVLNRLSASGSMGELTLAQRLRIVIDILSGLDHVHELTDYQGQPLGVVHRDVSPHNVFITYDGHVKLMDFGVAKTVAAAHLSRPGTVKGKLAYMAPDQLRASPIDRRADVFSVGVILWEMLSGRRLWPGKTEMSIVRHLSYGLPLPPLPEGLNLPAGLADVCGRALALNPADRFSTASQMEVELQRLLPAVADSYARHLGRIVSHAFAAERAERQALIDRHLLSLGSGDDFDVPTGMNPGNGAPAQAGSDVDDRDDGDGDGDGAFSDTAFSQPAMPFLGDSAAPDGAGASASGSLWRWGAVGVAVVAVPAIVILLLAFAFRKPDQGPLSSGSKTSIAPLATVAVDAKPSVEVLPRLLALTPEPAQPPRQPESSSAELRERSEQPAQPMNVTLGQQKRKPTSKRQEAALFSDDVEETQPSHHSRHRRGIDTSSPFSP